VTSRGAPTRVFAARLKTCAVLAALVLLVAPSRASAHAVLVRSSPPPGGQLSAAPAAVSATFSEPLNLSLSRLTLLGPDGRVVTGARGAVGATRLTLKPRRRLARGVYQVRWHSVSSDDGHALDGSYYFGVQTAAPANARASQAGPLAGGGWWRALLRAAFDATLLLFCGGVFCAALLACGRDPAAWLLPTAEEARTVAPEAGRLWRRIVWVGLTAVLAGTLSTLADAANAGQGLSGSGLHAYLLSDLTGEARIVMVGALIVAVALAALRAPVRAGVVAIVALAALTVSGHPNSAHSRGLAIASDLTHLAAAAVWVGGIAQIAWTWLPRLGALDGDGRRRVVEAVLPRFGRIALPAFATVVVAGVVNALVELGSVSALWDTGYGRVLIVKMALVGAIALASYGHALRIRPRLMRSNSQEDGSLERRHWRLLGSEPILGVGVALAAGLLIAYPPPNRTPAAEAAGSRPPPPLAVPRPPSAVVATGQLSVAEEAGPDIVAVWVTPATGGLSVQIHTLNVLERPTEAPLRIRHATLTGSCGPGCHTARVTGSPSMLDVQVSNDGHTYTARLPIRFQPASDALAQRLLSEAESRQLRLRSTVVRERLAGGPTPPNITVYELQAPDRFAYQLSRAGRRTGDTIIVGSREWDRTPGQRAWRAGAYGGGGQPFAATSYLDWWADYATQPRLLDLHRTGSITVADIATLHEIHGLGPVWLRLRFDVSNGRLLRLRMITAGHFMTQIWGSFNTPQRIEPPPARQVQPGRG
jgi:copper transport protein